jgi:hypothetical protein
MEKVNFKTLKSTNMTEEENIFIIKKVTIWWGTTCLGHKDLTTITVRWGTTYTPYNQTCLMWPYKGTLK